MSKLTRWMDRKLYPRHQANWDDQRFRDETLPLLSRAMTILDLGAGAGIVSQMNYRGLVEKVCGVDPDPRVTINPHLDEGRVGVGEAIPYDDESFDLVFADNVLEHLPQPVDVFREVARTLRPGGYFLTKTPNRRHYVPTIAHWTPHWFHEWTGSLRGRDSSDTFPTLYRANTPGDIRAIAEQAGLQVERFVHVEGRPEYLRVSVPTYLAGWMYERAVNVLPGLQGLRVLLITVMRKPALTQIEERVRAA